MAWIKFKNVKIVYFVRGKDLNVNASSKKNELNHKCKSNNLHGSHESFIFITTFRVWKA